MPPTVNVDSPAHKSEGQDTSPEFTGAFSDSESGLRKDTFRLYVDNTNDVMENGITGDNLALDLRVDGTDANNPYGEVTPAGGMTAVVESHRDYAGYGADDRLFGVIEHGKVFDLDTDDDDDIRSVDGDNHDDGAIDGTFGDSIRIAFDFRTTAINSTTRSTSKLWSRTVPATSASRTATTTVRGLSTTWARRKTIVIPAVTTF